MEKPNEIKGLTDLCPIFLCPFLSGKYVFEVGGDKIPGWQNEKKNINTRRIFYECSNKFIESERRRR